MQNSKSLILETTELKTHLCIIQCRLHWILAPLKRCFKWS